MYKRKRADDAAAEAAPRATRASTRQKTSASTSDDVAPESAPKPKNSAKTKGGGAEPEDAPKKRKTVARSRASAATKGKGKTKQTDTNSNEAASSVVGSSHHDRDFNSNGAPTGTSKKKDVAATPQPYSEARARELFKTYEDKDAPGEIGPEGFVKLCTNMEISLEGALPLLLAWQMQATEMAKFKENEWMQGVGELRVSNLQTLSLMLRDLDDLLLLDKPPIHPSGGSASAKKKAVAAPDSLEPYNRQKYHQYAADKEKALGELYGFCFTLAKPPSGRNIDMDTATAFWSVLVAPRYSILEDVVEFIKEKGTYKAVNKDLWNMVLEFCRTVHPDLSNYEADGAWPTFLDDFVAWKKAKAQTNTNQHHTDPVGVPEDDD